MGTIPGAKICNPTQGAELHSFVPAGLCLALTSSKDMLPSLGCPPLGATRTTGLRPAAAPFLLLKCEHELRYICLWIRMVWACFFPSAREKKIHELFFSLPDCFPGKLWAELIWLSPAGLPCDNYTTRPLPRGAFHPVQTRIWEEGCWCCIYILLLCIAVLLRATCPLPLPRSVQPFPPTPFVKCLMWLFSSALSSCRVTLLQSSCC